MKFKTTQMVLIDTFRVSQHFDLSDWTLEGRGERAGWETRNNNQGRECLCWIILRETWVNKNKTKMFIF